MSEMDWDKLYANNPTVPKPLKQAEPVTLPDLPDTDDVQELAKACSKLAVERLAYILANPTSAPGQVVAAAKEILDRGWGKPAQSVEHTGKVQFEQLIVECYPPTIEGHAIEVKTPQTAISSIPLESE